MWDPGSGRILVFFLARFSWLGVKPSRFRFTGTLVELPAPVASVGIDHFMREKKCAVMNR